MIEKAEEKSKLEGHIASSFVNLLKWREGQNLRVLNMLERHEKQEKAQRPAKDGNAKIQDRWTSKD